MSTALFSATIPPYALHRRRRDDLVQIIRERMYHISIGYFDQVADAGMSGLLEIAGLAGELEAALAHHCGAHGLNGDAT